MQFKVIPYGENAFLVQFKNIISEEVHLQVKAYYLQLKEMKTKGILSLIPAYNSVTIIFDIDVINLATLKNTLENNHPINIDLTNQTKNIIEIPVCYEKPYALDIDIVAKKLNLKPSEIIKLHTSKLYLVYMLGFSPGFMYLGGLNKQLQIPRKNTPRLKIAAGAVGLADQQTGVYPFSTPGGWQIIGQTPLKLFTNEQSSLVNMGDYVKFNPITINEFEKMNQHGN